MKQKITLILFTLSFGFLFSPMANVEAKSMNDIQQTSEYQQLKEDITTINDVNPENIDEFYNENEEWVEDVNVRLESLLENMPQEDVDAVLIDLQSNGITLFSPYTYFTSLRYHYRGGYWTYSMRPKTSTRLVKSYADAGWRELRNFYSLIRNDNGSLRDQYYCHYYARIEANWDIEVGRPNVGLARTIAAGCNP